MKLTKRDIIEAYVLAETQEEKENLGKIAEIITADMKPAETYNFIDAGNNLITVC